MRLYVGRLQQGTDHRSGGRAVARWQAWRRRSGFPTGRTLAILVAVGLGTELIGNIGVQWGYQVVGLAVMVPAYTGFLLVTTTVLGSLLLGERASPRNVVAVALLIVAVGLLGYGSAEANSAAVKPASPALVMAAIAVAAAAGIVFSLLAIAIRHCVTGSTSHSAWWSSSPPAACSRWVP